MSFGEGNLHDRVDYLESKNGEFKDEINRQEMRIRELEALVREMWAKLIDVPCGYDELGDMPDRVGALVAEAHK